MATVTGLIKEFLLPGSFWFLLIGITVGVVLLAGRPPLRRWGPRLLAGLAAIYWILSLPVVAYRLAGGLSTPYDTAKAGDLKAAQAVVVLGNGIHRYRAGELEINTVNEQSAYTVIESVRLYRLLGAPLMIVSGGIWYPEIYEETEAGVLRTVLLHHGVPNARIVVEDRSTTTREQALYLEPILRERGVDRFALVTTSVHMPRALAIFRAQGMKPIPAPSAYGSWQTEQVHTPWRPSARAWMLSQEALYEDIGLVYYRIRGWLPASSPSN